MEAQDFTIEAHGTVTPPRTLDFHKINIAVCEAFGINPHEVQEVKILLVHDDAPTIEVRYSVGYMARLDIDPEPLAQFKLVPVEEGGD